MEAFRKGYEEAWKDVPRERVTSAYRERRAPGFSQYKIHPSARFEGFYNKFTFPSGSVLLLILTRVPSAKPHDNHITIIFVPNDSNEIFREELWPDDLEFENEQGVTTRIRSPAYEAALRGSGLDITIAVRESSLRYNPDQTKKKEFAFLGYCPDLPGLGTSRIPWFGWTAKPEGFLSYLPLPLHWYVHTLATDMMCTMQLPAPFQLKPEDGPGCHAKLHAEKNWAHSFPSAHIWIAVREDLPEKDDKPQGKGLCLAGGQILGMQAFLVGFYDDSKKRFLNFRPPFALRFLGISPFMKSIIDWKSRTVELVFSSLTQKLTVKAYAPEETFFGITAPFHDGFRDNWLAQSMKATIEVETWRRKWWIFGSWIKESTHVFQRGALEFGGDYYDDRGVKDKQD